MRKLFIMTSLLIMTLSSTAKKDDPEDYKVMCTLADGSTIQGYCMTDLLNYSQPEINQVKISKTFKGETHTYSSEEIKRIVFTKTIQDSLPAIYESVMARKSMANAFNRKPKPYKKPVFLELIYNGKHVKGYKMPYLDTTISKTQRFNNKTWRYFYLVNGQEPATNYWTSLSGIIPGMKKVMKFYLKEFPTLVEMVDKEEITPQQFRNDPTMVLPIMDKTFSPQ